MPMSGPTAGECRARCRDILLGHHTIPLVPITSTSPATHLATLSLSSVNTYNTLLAEFPEITTPNFTRTPPRHGVEHYIVTNGPPVHARPRRLSPDKLARARYSLGTTSFFCLISPCIVVATPPLRSGIFCESLEVS